MFSIDYWNFVLYYVDMYVARARWPSSNGKTYESIYLRESFRQDGKVKKRDIANLTHCDPAEIAAIELALKHKVDLAALASLEGVQLQEGASVGAAWIAAEIARRLGRARHLAGLRRKRSVRESHLAVPAPGADRAPTVRRPPRSAQAGVISLRRHQQLSGR